MDYIKDKETLESIIRLHKSDLELPGLLPAQKEWLEKEIEKVEKQLSKLK